MSEAPLHPSAPDLQTLRRGHVRRLAGLDPMLPEPPSLLARPEASRLLAVDRDDSAAAGLWQVGTIGSTDYVASFSWLRRHTLHVFLDGPDRQTVTSLLLDRWCKDVAA